jgi:adenylylsulfate kinase
VRREAAHVHLLRNLPSVAFNYLDAGALRLVLAGVVESRAERARYQEAVGVDLVVCRLEVDLSAVQQRLVRRHEGDDPGLRWHLDRSDELDSILREAQVEDLVIDAADGSATEIAGNMLSAIGWR